MKRTLLLWAAVSLCGCSVQRHTSAAQQVQARSDEQTVVQTRTRTDSTAGQTTAADCVTTTTTDEFDTAQPVDPQTGTPPVKRRTTTRTHNRTATQTVAGQTRTSARVQHTTAAAELESRTDVAERTKRKLGTNILIWCILGALATGAGILIWKRFKQHINPF